MPKYFLALLLPVLCWSCKKNETVYTDTCSVEIRHQLHNPYLENSASLAAPTHQYVKFRIKDIEQYRNLEAAGVFLLDHPFDAIPDKNFQYATEFTHTYGIYYGVVPAGVNLAPYDAQKISDLYMPEAGRVERVSGEVREFSGTVTFFDPVDSALVPLKGLKVMIRDATRVAWAITDKDGHFSIASPLIVSDTVEVLLKFDNDEVEIHTLDLANLSAVFGTNIFSCGFKKSCGFTDMKIEIGRQFNNAALHHSCAALHSLNEYRNFANQYGLLLPDKKFLFWIAREAPLSESYATPMLRNMAQQNIANPTQLLANLFGIPSDLAGMLSLIIKDQLPDIYAPFYNRFSTAARASFIETMFHELAHASHYAKVGPAFWVPYVEYIYGNGGYGEDSLANSGIISLSEAWAEDLSNIGLNHIYGKQKYLDLNENNQPFWIPYGIYHDLFDGGTNESFDNTSGITFTELYNLLTVDVNSPELLKAKLKSIYPVQQVAIDTLYTHYGH